MKVVIPKETAEYEKRIAATAETVKKMAAAGMQVWVQAGAGEASSISDSDFTQAGAKVEAGAKALYAGAAMVLRVQRPDPSKELPLIPQGACLIGLLQPLIDPAFAELLAEKKITSLSMDMIPRIARAQRLDALSSQSNIAGYKAVLMAANALTKMMPLMMTAAGTVSPAKVLVLGAGVAGLQAIATARRLGAVVEAFDTRPVVKEQVESLGGRFLSLDLASSEAEDKGGYAKELSKEQHEREMELIARHVETSDIVITTAQIPGKKSQLLIREESVKKLKFGSIIVDLAVEGGGNCEAAVPGEDVVKHGVRIIGHYNVPSLMAAQASQLYARNISGLLLDIVKEGRLRLNLEDEIIRGALITHEGRVVHPVLGERVKAKGAAQA